MRCWASLTVIGKSDLGFCEIRSRIFVFLRTREPWKRFQSVRGPVRIICRYGIWESSFSSPPTPLIQSTARPETTYTIPVPNELEFHKVTPRVPCYGSSHWKPGETRPNGLTREFGFGST